MAVCPTGQTNNKQSQYKNGWTSVVLHSLPLTSSHLLLIPPSYSAPLPNLLLPPPKESQMTSQFMHEEISMLFCSEKFSGGGGGIAIIASSFRSRSLRDLR